MSAMREAAHHTFLLLTKAPRNIVPELLPPNLWIGTSVATQLEVGRVDHLVEHGGQRKKWLSFEPLLSAVSWPGGYPIDAVVVGALTRNGRTVPPERGGTSRAWVDRITVQAAAEGIPVFYKSNLLPLFRDDPMPQNPPPWRTE
jgi:protein gp37